MLTMFYIGTNNVVFVCFAIYYLLFPIISIATVIYDIRFLFGIDEKSKECWKIYPQICLISVGTICVIVISFYESLQIGDELTKVDNNQIDNAVILKIMKKNVCNKVWNFTMCSTVLQVLLFVGQIYTYRIIDAACPVVMGSTLWIGYFNGIHHDIRYIFLYGSLVFLLLIFIWLLFEIISKVIKIWKVKKENECIAL